jgi:UDP-N-acetylmuramyl pentapeptide phosphotransferase/UDP-N-acetylglucosamine-1-phosphate transferase
MFWEILAAKVTLLFQLFFYNFLFQLYIIIVTEYIFSIRDVLLFRKYYTGFCMTNIHNRSNPNITKEKNAIIIIITYT